MFYIGFGLDMNDKQISEFLTLVLKEPDFDFTSPSETIYWHCRYNGKSWMEAQKLLEAYENQAEDPSIRENHMWQAMQNEPENVCEQRGRSGEIFTLSETAWRCKNVRHRRGKCL
ncbi:MAG: hypothetical protein ACLRIT_12510 [Blautia sp.]